jgi:hypothetical protein
MPFDPNSPASNVPEDDGFPNDWFVPEADGYPNDWFVPEADGYPSDWFVPDSRNVPAPTAAPSTTPLAASPQPDPASTRPAARFDPYAAFWSQVPASRVGAMAWHPPIFLSPDSFSSQDTPALARGGPPARFANPLAQYLPAASVLPTLPPDLPAGGILGGIPKLAAAYSPSDQVSIAASRGLFGSLANSQPAASNAAAASILPMSWQYLSPDSIVDRGGNSYAIPRNNVVNRGDATVLAPSEPPTDEAFGSALDQHNWNPYLFLINGDELWEHGKPDPSVLSGITDVPLWPPPKWEQPLQIPFPFFLPQSDASGGGGGGSTSLGNSSPAQTGEGSSPPTSSEPNWAKLTEQIKEALSEGPERLQAVISAGLPKYDDTTTYGVLITNEGDIVPLKSGNASSFYENYESARHVEGKGAIWIREHGSTGGVLYHNNTDGICGYCDYHLETLLPKDSELLVIPPVDAVAKNERAKVGPTLYKGNSALPKPPPQYDLFRSQP